MALALAPESPQRAVIYCRISKDDAGDELGVERQARMCHALAKREGYDVVDVLTDNDESAYSRKRRRPAFERLMRLLETGGEVDAVIVYHVDRLYRRVADLDRIVAAIEGSRTRVHTVAAGNLDLSTASGIFVAQMLGGAAQLESGRLSERLKAKMDELAAKGTPPAGRPPYGYGPGYVVDPTEAKNLRLMARRVLEGSSLLNLARELDAAGITPRKATRWNSTSIRTALLNPAVVGLRVHRREIAGAAVWEPILDRDTWESVKAVLADPARKHTRPARKYLLSGLVFTNDGARMNGRMDRGAGDAPKGTERNRPTYATRSNAKQAQAVDAVQLEDHVVAALLAALDGAPLPAPSPDAPASSDIERIEAELAELAGLRGRGDITLAEWMAARKPLLARLDEAKSAAVHVRRRPAEIDALLRKGGALRKAWGTLSFAQKRAVLDAVIERVVVDPATNARHTPIEARVPIETNIRWRA